MPEKPLLLCIKLTTKPCASCGVTPNKTAQSRCSYGHEILSENEFYLVSNACYRAQLAMLKSLRHKSYWCASQVFLTEYTKDSTTDQTVHIIKSETVYTVHIVATNSTYVIYIQYMYNTYMYNTRRHRGLNLSLGTNPDNDTYVANTSPKHESIVKP